MGQSFIQVSDSVGTKAIKGGTSLGHDLKKVDGVGLPTEVRDSLSTTAAPGVQTAVRCSFILVVAFSLQCICYINTPDRVAKLLEQTRLCGDVNHGMKPRRHTWEPTANITDMAVMSGVPTTRLAHNILNNVRILRRK